jgi:hypothetical protein
MHDPALQMDNVVMHQSWVYDEQIGTKPLKGYEDARPGSWFAVFKVENDAVWQLVKEGKVKGFSVEGFFGTKPAQMKEEVLFQKITDILKCVQD